VADGALRRHARVALQLTRASIATQAQYRVDLAVQVALAGFWVVWNVAPLRVVFSHRERVGGWTEPEAMLVMSAFLVLKALLEGLVMPNLSALVQHVRTGTFDFILLKPVDAQVVVSFQKVLVPKGVDLAAGLAIAAWSIGRLDPRPGPGALAAGVAMLVAGAVLVHALWMLVISTAFWVVKVDNLGYLLSSIFDAGRWPAPVFRGWVRVVLTFVLPVVMMTSYPAMAVLGRLDAARAAVAWGVTLALTLLSRAVWRVALGRYASASS
jgi:ABC-2 type transport system permease protein